MAVAKSRQKRVALHIGAHKTGSSSIQASFLSLVSPDHKYISFTSNGNDSGPFLTAFSDDPTQVWTHKYRGWSHQQILDKKAEILQYYTTKISQAKANNLVFSGEGISKLPSSSLRRIKQFFEERDCDVTIYIYMRPLHSVIPSNFQQFLTAPPSIWTREFTLHEFPSMASLARKCLPGYPLIVENLLQVFSKSQIHFLPFAKSIFPGGDVVLDFADRINIPGTLKNIVRINEACSALATKILWLEGLGSSWTDKTVSFSIRAKMVNHLKSEFSSCPGMAFCVSILQPLLADIQAEYSYVNELIQNSSACPDFDMCALPNNAEHRKRSAAKDISDLARFSPEEKQSIAKYVKSHRGSLNPGYGPIEIAQTVARIAYSMC